MLHGVLLEANDSFADGSFDLSLGFMDQTVAGRGGGDQGRLLFPYFAV